MATVMECLRNGVWPRPQFCLVFLILIAMLIYYIDEILTYYMASVDETSHTLVEMESAYYSAVGNPNTDGFVSMDEIRELKSGLRTVEHRLEALEGVWQRVADSKEVEKQKSRQRTYVSAKATDEDFQHIGISSVFQNQKRQKHPSGAAAIAFPSLDPFDLWKASHTLCTSSAQSRVHTVYRPRVAVSRSLWNTATH